MIEIGLDLGLNSISLIMISDPVGSGMPNILNWDTLVKFISDIVVDLITNISVMN